MLPLSVTAPLHFISYPIHQRSAACGEVHIIYLTLETKLDTIYSLPSVNLLACDTEHSGDCYLPSRQGMNMISDCRVPVNFRD